MGQYTESYEACLHGRRFATKRLAGDAKEVRDTRSVHMCSTAVVAWMRRGTVGVDTVRQIHFLFTKATVPSFGVSSKLCMSNALQTL